MIHLNSVRFLLYSVIILTSKQLGEEFFALEIADRYHAVKKMRPNTLASQLSAPPCF